MSTAKLNVWITEVGNSCRIDMKNKWFIHVLHCDGTVLDWCDTLYTNLETKCGHREIEVPPGCYMVCATWRNRGPGQAGTPTKLGNHITHVQVVNTSCGGDICVVLFPPTMHHCGIWWQLAVKEAIKGKQLPKEAQGAAEAAVRAVDDLLKVLPPEDEVTRNMRRIADNPPKKN